MKPSKVLVVSVLTAIPIAYLAGYVGLFATAGQSTPMSGFGSTRPSIQVHANQVSILTRNDPLANAAVKVFEPLMKLHGRVSGTAFLISDNEFS